jgi:hypothetical protein
MFCLIANDNLRKISFLFLLLFVSSCADSNRTTAFDEANVISANMIAKKNEFKKELVYGGKFTITTYSKITNPSSDDYVIYIEGDGHITKFGGSPSSNPTPINHLVLRLAVKDIRENVIYVARPCQYTPMRMNPNCTPEYWTNKRFSEYCVDNINNVINSVAAKAKNIHLVGFSGGGGMAILVAAKNNKVKDIVTVAGNLDIVGFTKYHKNIPLIGSLNPIDYAQKVKNIPQIHFVGSKDAAVPFFIADSFVRKSNSVCVKYKIVEGNTHSLGWLEDWENLLNTQPNCEN